MNYAEAVAYLAGLGHETVAIKLGLEKIRLLLAHLGDPQKQYQKVQIAGTNGKGSTAAFLDSICRAAEIRTALYTSPHLIEPTERIRIDGVDIAREDFARLATTVRNAGEEMVVGGKLPSRPTFFEHLTAMFLLAAAEAKVEVAILETGLGGRLDATTAAEAEIVAITPIALDHQEYLGNTLAEIAAEKAAIIRPGVMAVAAPQLPEAVKVIEGRARLVRVDLRWLNELPDVVGTTSDGCIRANFTTANGCYRDVTLGLRGRHQLVNAQAAIGLAEALRQTGSRIPDRAIVDGLQNAWHPGRLELWRSEPDMLFDGAHNAAGAQALADYLSEFLRVPLTLVFGAMRDKPLTEIESILFPFARHIVLTEPKSPRAATVEALREQAPPALDPDQFHLMPAVNEALQTARRLASPEGLICVTGSLYLVGEAQSILLDPLLQNPWRK